MNEAATQDLRVVACVADDREVLGRPRAERAGCAGGEPDLELAAGAPARSRPRRQGRRPGRGSDGRRVAAARRRGHGTRPRAARPAPGGAAAAQPRPGPERIRVHGWLVRLRRQGPAHAARPRRPRAVLAPVLRRRRRSRPAGRRCGPRSTPLPRELEAKQGPDPSRWRADATAERIRFTSGVLPDTMRWTNRPTFQQVMSFSSHRPR